MVVSSVDVGTGVEKWLEVVGVIRVKESIVYGWFVAGVVLACIGAVFEECGDTTPVGAAGGGVKRTVTTEVIYVWICAIAQEKIDSF
jgi:hypothetical protein